MSLSARLRVHGSNGLTARPRATAPSPPPSPRPRPSNTLILTEWHLLPGYPWSFWRRGARGGASSSGGAERPVGDAAGEPAHALHRARPRRVSLAQKPPPPRRRVRVEKTDERARCTNARGNARHAHCCVPRGLLAQRGARGVQRSAHGAHYLCGGARRGERPINSAEPAPGARKAIRRVAVAHAGGWSPASTVLPARRARARLVVIYDRHRRRGHAGEASEH